VGCRASVCVVELCRPLWISIVKVRAIHVHVVFVKVCIYAVADLGWQSGEEAVVFLALEGTALRSAKHKRKYNDVDVPCPRLVAPPLESRLSMRWSFLWRRRRWWVYG
jgi:hypothetical protein